MGRKAFEKRSGIIYFIYSVSRYKKSVVGENWQVNLRQHFLFNRYIITKLLYNRFLPAVASISLMRFNWFTSLAPGS